MLSPIRKVVCTTDFSAAASQAVARGVAIAKQLGAETHLLHAFSVPVVPSPVGGDFTVQSLFPQLEEAAKYEMSAAIREWNKRQIDVVPHVVAGPAAEMICAQSAKIGADMIVVGTHGRSGLAHLLVGSVAERVIRTATIPVVTIRTL